MIVWIVLFFLMCFIFVVEYLGKREASSVNEMTIFLVVLLSLLSGLRGDMGVDLQNYLRYFEEIPVFTDLLFGKENFIELLMVEPLYSLVISLFKVITTNYNLYLFFQSLLLLVLVVISLRRLNAPVNIGLIFYFLYSYLDHFSQQRMAIVYVLCLFATTYIVRKGLLKFLLTILVASLIQYTAIFFLPAYWIRYLLLSKSRRYSFRFNYLKKAISNTKSSFMRPNSKHTYWTQIKLFKIVIPLIIVFSITLKLDIAKLIYDNVDMFTFGNPAGNIYAVKFMSYYERMTIDRDILNAWFGIMSYFMVIAFLYIYRSRWLDTKTAPIFINFVAGLILFVIAYDIPKLGDRLFQMYNISVYVALFSIIAYQKRRPLNILPFIFFILTYQFIQTIVSETGPYRLLGY